MLFSLNWILTKETNSSNGRYWMLFWYLRFDFSWFCISEISEKDSISVSFFETRKMQTKQVDCISLDGAAALFYSLLSFLAFVGLPIKSFHYCCKYFEKSICLCLVCMYPCLLGNMGLPCWPSGEESACQCRRRRFKTYTGKIPWRSKWQPSPVFLPRKSQG